VGGKDGEARERLVALGEIASEIAHELRNVLQVIAASAYLARQDPAQSGPHIGKIERNARVAHGIVDDLMALARGDALHAEPSFVADIIVLARADFASGDAVWDDTLEPPDVKVRAHPGLLARLLHALYENSVAICAPRPPVITTRARCDGARAVLEIGDDGPGVPAEIAPRIFDALFTSRPGGTGLGLALARRIAAAHGGSIALVPSEKGATFRIELPAP